MTVLQFPRRPGSPPLPIRPLGALSPAERELALTPANDVVPRDSATSHLRNASMLLSVQLDEIQLAPQELNPGDIAATLLGIAQHLARALDALEPKFPRADGLR